MSCSVIPVDRIRQLVPYMSQREIDAVSHLVEGIKLEEEQELLWNKMSERVASWDAGPLLWLTHYTKTEDTHWLTKNTAFLAPFPKKEYLRVVLDYLINSRSIFIPKSREMMMSWLVCSYIAWMCQWYPVFWVAQTGKEDKVAELIEYARTLYRNQPDWMKARNPLVVDSVLEIAWKNGGRFLGIPKGADQIRVYHCYGYFQDESGFLPEAQTSYDAVRPVAKQMVCVSTDEMGWFHSECKLD
jgi:hypothetical protein